MLFTIWRTQTILTLSTLLLALTNAEDIVGEVCQTHTNNSIPYFCRSCLDRFEGLGYNPWIRFPDKPGLLINHKLPALGESSCEIYNPAAMCDPNRNMNSITFTLGGDGSYLYVNFTSEEKPNFMDKTVYIQCDYHDPPVCLLLTFVEECPPLGFTMAAKVSITIVAVFIALVLIIVIILMAVFCIRRQCKRLRGRSYENKLFKYTQMN